MWIKGEIAMKLFVSLENLWNFDAINELFLKFSHKSDQRP